MLRDALRSLLRAIPNLISLSRLALAAAFATADSASTRALVVLAASVTDVLDGWLARMMRTQSRTGALIDPIADRAFVTIAVATLAIEGAVSPVDCALLLFRDGMTVIGYFVAKAVPSLKAVTFKARVSGKVTTGMQLLTLVAALVRPVWVPGLVVGVGLVSLWAVADYTWMLHRSRARA
ncbi:MAG: CDP-alcohol phosphatidyltransferase family protein [Gemmatimonadetes bacterium]|nr:CDP-alcohol phosphatidyltransferase family protein [Gemmatimonadota bacterium]